MSKAGTEADRKAQQSGAKQSDSGANRQGNDNTRGKDAMSHTKGGTKEGAGGGKKQERRH